VTLTYRFRRYWFGTTTSAVITSDGKCDGPHWDWDKEKLEFADPPAATLAHVGFEIVAQVLAAPLRRAYYQHRDEAEEEHKRVGGTAHCGECDRLLAMLPEGDRPIAIA
jgi:hypothetical protein